MYLTVKEVASIIRTSEKQTYKLVNENIIPHIRIGGKILINQHTLEKHLKDLEVNKKEV